MTRFAGAQKVPDKRVEMVIRKGFLSAADCAGLVSLINVHRRPSTITDAYGAGSDFRTSETADLPADDPLVGRVYRQLADYAGLDIAHAEADGGQVGGSVAEAFHEAVVASPTGEGAEVFRAVENFEDHAGVVG